eukprot:CAMPEP_0172408902 /NCGR_PEP_ID=MMETSP1061-20121228/76093_1 /TAXON_ID=37318 /ORGANISM="Pseudo-nitzschia pungens, Strain cf. pungens" /LENGTH=178 /DNA_ID=CAMNT_0013145045 /DNA_START=65 /DNA_END=601 /DNA_ORIENTATION=-
MKQLSILVGSIICLLQLFGNASASEEQESAHEAVGMECLATTTDLNSFRCISSGESLRVPCTDEDSRCGEWAGNGECKSNPQYMLVQCRKSCSSCISLHSGDESQVAYDDTRSDVLRRLYETQEYLHKEAKRNVESLKRCVNNYSECTHWWSIGECNKNPQFMHTECSAACQTCKKIV